MNPLVTGVGMASSVGDAFTAAAAIRAGISRPHPLDTYELPGDELQPVRLIGHPVRDCTEGTYFVGRWVRLAHAALLDLATRAPLDDARRWARTGLVVAVPDDLVERYDREAEVTDAELHQRYVSRVLRLVGWPIAPAHVRLSRCGHAGGVDGLRIGRALIEQGLERVIVLAADSFVETTTLTWLHQQDRLKTPDNPVGVIPGEAAACLLLEAETAARRHSAEVVLTSVELEREPSFDPARGRGLGPALARAIERALRASLTPLPFAGDVQCDLDGLEHRAYDLGVMLSRLDPAVLHRRHRLRIPAVELGYTGAASGVIAAVLAVRALQRGYARSPTVLITSRDDRGSVGAACFNRASAA